MGYAVGLILGVLFIAAFAFVLSQLLNWWVDR